MSASARVRLPLTFTVSPGPAGERNRAALPRGDISVRSGRRTWWVTRGAATAGARPGASPPQTRTARHEHTVSENIPTDQLESHLYVRITFIDQNIS